MPIIAPTNILPAPYQPPVNSLVNAQTQGIGIGASQPSYVTAISTGTEMGIDNFVGTYTSMGGGGGGGMGGGGGGGGGDSAAARKQATDAQAISNGGAASNSAAGDAQASAINQQLAAQKSAGVASYASGIQAATQSGSGDAVFSSIMNPAGQKYGSAALPAINGAISMYGDRMNPDQLSQLSSFVAQQSKIQRGTEAQGYANQMYSTMDSGKGYQDLNRFMVTNGISRGSVGGGNFSAQPGGTNFTPRGSNTPIFIPEGSKELNDLTRLYQHETSALAIGNTLGGGVSSGGGGEGDFSFGGGGGSPVNVAKGGSRVTAVASPSAGGSERIMPADDVKPARNPKEFEFAQERLASNKYSPGVKDYGIDMSDPEITLAVREGLGLRTDEYQSLAPSITKIHQYYNDIETDLARGKNPTTKKNALEQEKEVIARKLATDDWQTKSSDPYFKNQYSEKMVEYHNERLGNQLLNKSSQAAQGALGAATGNINALVENPIDWEYFFSTGGQKASSPEDLFYIKNKNTYMDYVGKYTGFIDGVTRRQYGRGPDKINTAQKELLQDVRSRE